jgi:uncharacterized membrane protein (DUF485 family)
VVVTKETSEADPANVGQAPIWFSAGACALYFTLMWLCVAAKPALGVVIVPGLSVGIALTVGGVLLGMGMTWIYVRQANGIDQQ